MFKIFQNEKCLNIIWNLWIYYFFHQWKTYFIKFQNVQYFYIQQNIIPAFSTVVIYMELKSAFFKFTKKIKLENLYNPEDIFK